MDTPVPILVTFDEACALLGVSRSTLYNLIADGRIPKRKLGAKSMFRRSDLEEFVASLPAA